MAVKSLSWKKFYDSDKSIVDQSERRNMMSLQRMDSCRVVMQRSLHRAAREGNVALVKDLLKEIHDYVESVTSITKYKRQILFRKLNAKDDTGYTALHYAAQKNNKEICELLYINSTVKKLPVCPSHIDEDDSQLDLKARNKDGATPFHFAAQGNRLASDESQIKMDDEEEIVESFKVTLEQKNCLGLLLEWCHGEHMENIKDDYEMTPLHWACQRNNPKAAVKLLAYQHSKYQVLQQGIKTTQFKGIGQLLATNHLGLLHAKAHHNYTPLHICAMHQSNETASILMEMGADLTLADTNGSTPLHFAVAEGNLAMCERMLQCTRRRNGDVGVESLIEIADASSNTALHVAAQKSYIKILHLLLENGSQSLLSQRNSKANTALHIAAKVGCLEIVKDLVTADVNLHQTNAVKMTALHIAAKYNNTSIVEFLFNKGASLDTSDSLEMTPLLTTAFNGHVETFQYLLEHNCVLADDDIEERTCLHLAAQENRLEIMKIILGQDSGFDLVNKADHRGNTPLNLAAIRGYQGVAKLLLRFDCCKITVKDENGKNSLHLAAKFGRKDIIELLLNKYPSQIHAKDEEGNTPLITAAIYGRVTTLGCLITLGANVDDRNCNNYTALSCCALRDFTKSAKILIQSGATINYIEQNMPTPLQIACKQGSTNMVRLLLKSGANVTIPDTDGLCALELAVKHGHKNCAKIILTSPKWKAALRSSNYSVGDGRLSTPLRQMIKTMPEMAELVFNRCTKISPNVGTADEQYNVQFDFEFLNDDYASVSWNSLMEGGEAALAGDTAPCFEENALDYNLKPYCHDNKILRDNHPLAIMSRSKNTSLLTHPLVNVLLKYKWNRFGRAIYSALLSLYIMYLFSLTVYFVSLPPPFAVRIIGSGKNACFVIHEDLVHVWKYDCDCCTYGNQSSFHLSFTIVILLISAISLIKEALQLVQRRAGYFKEVDNYLEVTSYVLSYATVINWSETSSSTGIKEHWQWQLAAVCVFTSWMNLALFVRKLPSLGIYVIMVQDISITFAKFLTTFLIFIVGYALFFYMILQNQDVFNTWWESIIKTAVMMIGELDYGNLFYSEGTWDCLNNSTSCYSTAAVYYPEITFIFFTTFLIAMPIIIINLLVGLAVDDIKAVQDQATRQKLILQVKLALDVEYLLPGMLRKHLVIGKHIIYPNKYRRRIWFIRYFLEDDITSTENITRTLLAQKETRVLILDQHEEIQRRNKKIGDRLSMLLSETKKLNECVTTLAKQYDMGGMEIEEF